MMYFIILISIPSASQQERMERIHKQLFFHKKYECNLDPLFRSKPPTTTVFHRKTQHSMYNRVNSIFSKIYRTRTFRNLLKFRLSSELLIPIAVIAAMPTRWAFLRNLIPFRACLCWFWYWTIEGGWTTIEGSGGNEIGGGLLGLCKGLKIIHLKIKYMINYYNYLMIIRCTLVVHVYTCTNWWL